MLNKTNLNSIFVFSLWHKTRKTGNISFCDRTTSVITDELNNENYNEISDFTNELSLLQYCITCLVNEGYRLIQCSESWLHSRQILNMNQLRIQAKTWQFNWDKYIWTVLFLNLHSKTITRSNVTCQILSQIGHQLAVTMELPFVTKRSWACKCRSWHSELLN